MDLLINLKDGSTKTVRSMINSLQCVHKEGRERKETLLEKTP